MGRGGHGAIFRATLSLAEPWRTVDGDTMVNVAVKFADSNMEARQHFKHEITAYGSLSRTCKNFLQQDWKGYVACWGTYGHLARCVKKRLQPTVAPLKAVVPKFFGSYEAAEATGDPSSLFLIEDCGRSVNNFFKDHKTEEYPHIVREIWAQVPAMYASLHRTGLLQGSVKSTNLAIQPGPLSSPMKERSYNSPSFRILDFGRTRIRENADCQDAFGDLKLSKHDFKQEAHEELKLVLELTERWKSR